MENPWRKASEELPPVGVHVICCMSTSFNMGVFCFGAITNKGNWQLINNHCGKEVTHWMRIPEVPE